MSRFTNLRHVCEKFRLISEAIPFPTKALTGSPCDRVPQVQDCGDASVRSPGKVEVMIIRSSKMHAFHAAPPGKPVAAEGFADVEKLTFILWIVIIYTYV